MLFINHNIKKIHVLYYNLYYIVMNSNLEIKISRDITFHIIFHHLLLIFRLVTFLGTIDR